jgi:hypothetical protein
MFLASWLWSATVRLVADFNWAKLKQVFILFGIFGCSKRE